jgi:O-antigen ligase
MSSRFLEEHRWTQNKNITPIAVSIIAGVLFSIIVLTLGIMSVPLIVFTLLILPWLLKDVFRLFVFLIITWPILTLFVRLPLPAGVPDLTYERALVLLLVGFVLIEALLRKRQLLKLSVLDILVGIYVIAQLSSRLFVLWFGGTGNPDLNGLLDIILIPIILYWLIKNLLVSREHLKWFLASILIACLLIGLTGLYEQAAGVRIFHLSVNLGGTDAQYMWQDVPGGRAAGAMINPAIYGAVLGIGVLAGIGLLPHIKQKLTRVAILAILGVLMFGVFASYTRSAWLSVFIVLFLAQFFITGLWKKTLPIFMLGLLVFAFVWNQIPAISIAVNRATFTDSLPIRFELIKIGWEEFLQRPLLGWGTGAYNAISFARVRDQSHNIYLTFLVDGGLALFLSFIVAIGYLLLRAIRIYRIAEKNSLERDAVVAMAGCVLIFLLSGLALELRYFSYINALFWIGAGVIDIIGLRQSHDGLGFS